MSTISLTYAGRHYEIDFSRPSGELSELHKLDKATISRLRGKHAPKTLAERTVDPTEPVAEFPNLGAFLAACSERAGSSYGGQAEVARKLALNPTTIRRYFATPPELYPSPEVLEKLVKWWRGLTVERPHRPVSTEPVAVGSGKSAAKSHSVRLPADLYALALAVARRANITIEQLVEQKLRTVLRADQAD